MIVDKIKKRENNIKTNKKSNIDIPIGKWIKCDNFISVVHKSPWRKFRCLLWYIKNDMDVIQRLSFSLHEIDTNTRYGSDEWGTEPQHNSIHRRDE